MNYLNPPPMREPIAEIDNSEFGKPVLGDMSAAWLQWISNLMQVVNQTQATGTTAQRPNPTPFVGFMYFDTTLGKPIWAKTTTTWVDSAGVAA